MSKPHKHADVIKAWADGIEIEYNYGDGWFPAPPNPAWCLSTEYRVKKVPTLSTKASALIEMLIEKHYDRLMRYHNTFPSAQAMRVAKEALEAYVVELENKD